MTLSSGKEPHCGVGDTLQQADDQDQVQSRRALVKVGEHEPSQGRGDRASQATAKEGHRSQSASDIHLLCHPGVA